MGTRVLNPLFNVAGLEMSRIWHCFGNYMHKVDLWTIQRMLNASGTNVLPINTHRLTPALGRDGLEVGFSGVTIDRLGEARSLAEFVLMLNINHQVSAAAAVAKTQLAHELTSETIVKLEVLNGDLRTSNDAQLIEAVRELRRTMPHLILMPLLSNNVDTARRLIDLGCPLLRVMGGAIGSGAGIVDREEFARVCALPVPVVLDGGVSQAADFAVAHAAGAQGCLINSALFSGAAPPDVVLSTFVRTCAPLLASFEPTPATTSSTFTLASNCRATRPITVTHGAGVAVWDSKGRRYIDLSSQTMNLLMGQCHPEINEAIAQQLHTLSFIDQDFGCATYEEAMRALAPSLPRHLTVFNFRMSDGSSGVECAIKMARRARGRGRVLTFDGIYVGQNTQSLHLRGWGPKRSELLHGSTEDVVFAPVPRPDYRLSLDQAPNETGERAGALIDEHHEALACVLVDPVMISSGVTMGRAMPTLLRAVIERAHAHDVPVVVDECQTFGWVPDGTLSRHLGLDADFVVLGKGIGGGMPLSVCAARQSLDGLEWGDADYTNGGTLAAMAGLLATCRILARDETRANATGLEDDIDVACSALTRKLGARVATRGIGLIRAIQLHADNSVSAGQAATQRVVARALANGVIVRRHLDCLTLKPAVVADRDDVRHALDTLVDAIIGEFNG